MKNKRVIAVIFLLITVSISLLMRNSRWDGYRRIILILQSLSPEISSSTSQMVVFSIEPSKNRAVYLLFPGNTLLDVPYGYKKYMAGNVYKLGELDVARGGGKLLKKSIEITFGLSVEGYLIESENVFSLIAKDRLGLEKIKKSFFTLSGSLLSIHSILNWSGQTKTDFSFIDRFRLWNAVRKIRADQITFIDLADDRSLTFDNLPDGTSVRNLDRELLNLTISDNFQDSAVRSEKVTLEIVNATDQEKLAAIFSDILEAMGANVVVRSTAKEKAEEACLLYLANDELKKTVIADRLSHIFGCKCVGGDKGKEESNQSDIKIVLGEGFIK